MHWDGQNWQRVAAPASGPGGQLHAVSAVDANDIWAVGSKGASATLVEHWDGLNWRIVGSPDPGTPVVLAGTG